MFLRPRTTKTNNVMRPTVPQAKVSARVKPAGSPVWMPESLISLALTLLAVAFLFADGAIASPNLSANSVKLVDAGHHYLHLKKNKNNKYQNHLLLDYEK
ncbi:hypothetical protein LguiB_012596 [Lonicera macranthoides]